MLIAVWVRYAYSRRERAYRQACLWVCLFVIRGLDFFFRFATKFFVKNPPAKIDSKFYLFLAKFNQERPKSSQNGAKTTQHGPKRGPNGPKRAQHLPKGRRKWTKKHKKIDARKKIGSRTLPGIGGTRLLEVFWPKGSPRGSIFEIILVPSSIKNAVKNRSRNRVSKKHEKHNKQSKERCEQQ